MPLRSDKIGKINNKEVTQTVMSQDMNKVEQGRSRKNAEQEKKARSVTYKIRDLHPNCCQKQNSNKFQKSDNYFTDENESFEINYSSSQPEDFEKITERQINFQVPLKQSRKQAFRNITLKSRNNNRDFLENTNGRIMHSEAKNTSRMQNPNFCPKADKSTATNKQNMKHDESNKNMHFYNLDNNPPHVIGNEDSAKMENSSVFKVKSTESIPYNRFQSYESISFNNFELIELLYYNVDLMQHEQLFNYTYALKERILERILEFKDPVQEELEFLCIITDGSQTNRNQKLITRRMYFIVSRAVEEAPEKFQSSSMYSSYHETQESVQNQNSDLISRTDELNELSKHDENIKPVILNKNSDSCNKNKENTIGSILDVNDNCNNEVDSFPNRLCEAVCVADTNLKTNDELYIRATESIDTNTPLICKDTTYDCFNLEDLLRYNVDAMQGSSLLGYAFALKNRISENIFKFQLDIREKLEFLCELTDGSQTEVNQKLIIMRMCHLIDYDGSFLRNYNSFSGFRKNMKPKKLTQRKRNTFKDH